MEYSGNFCLCRICSVKVLGLLVLSVLNVQTCETWNYVEYSSPLVYPKFYSSDSKTWFGKLKVKVFNFKQGRMIPYMVS